MVEGIVPYLKCNYGEGCFNHEYFVDFRVSEKGQSFCFVNKVDVLPLNEREGLLKLLASEDYLGDEEKKMVKIRDIGDNRISNFVVYPEDIIFLQGPF